MLRKKTVQRTVFADVATSVSEAIGALRRKIPITCSKKRSYTFECGFSFLFYVGNNFILSKFVEKEFIL